MTNRRRLAIVVIAASLFGGAVAVALDGASVAGAVGSSQPGWWAARGPKAPGDGGTLDAAAKALGITTDELKTDLHSGKTIAQIAADHHVDLGAVIDAMVAAAQAELRQHITDFANNGHPGHDKDHPKPPGKHGHGHDDHDPDESTSSSSSSS